MLRNIQREQLGQKEGWVFPSKKSTSGHIGLSGIEHAFRKLARKFGIPDALKLYCARHTFGTVAMAETRNPGLVKEVMGHESLDTTTGYLHPETSQINNRVPFAKLLHASVEGRLLPFEMGLRELRAVLPFWRKVAPEKDAVAAKDSADFVENTLRIGKVAPGSHARNHIERGGAEWQCRRISLDKSIGASSRRRIKAHVVDERQC